MADVTGIAWTVRKVLRFPRAARAGIAGVTMAAALAAVSAQPALASWQQPSYPRPAGATTWTLNGVSCQLKGLCAAVGSFSDGTHTHLVTEQLTGSGWSVQPTPEPAGATSSEFDGVSCSGLSFCAGVGDTSDGSVTATLAETWNGSGWTLGSSPNTGATVNSLLAVSCTSHSACMAVGGFGDGVSTSTALAESWNGSSWKMRSVPLPAGSTSSTLGGVSCTSALHCIAVGDSGDGSTTVPLAESWNGSSWAIQSVPDPSGTFNELNAVSCAAAKACTAVGRGFAERWNGSSWAIQTIASPHGETDLTGVACATTTSCEGVGSFFNRDGVQMANAEVWDGSVWKDQSVPITTSFDLSFLNGVSCTTATACTAAGVYHDPVDGDQGLLESAALRWQPIVPTVPTGAIASSLDSLSCTSPTFCMGIGNLEASGSTFSAYSDMWDGNFWIERNTPNGDNSSLSGVFCTGKKACTAVGDVLSGGVLVTLAERWNGSGWTVQPTPNPAGASRSFLLSVSCPTGTSCTAVGEYTASSGHQLTLAEHWNGSTWSLTATKNPAGSTTDTLKSVSCASTSSCMAVGSDQQGMLSERWNGSNWKTESVLTPSGESDASLQSVSCAAPSACTAVGSIFNSVHTVPLAERWNGSSWGNQAIPAPGHSQVSGLEGVSCVTATRCSAVGFARSPSVSMAEHWISSKWFTQSAPPPFGSQQSDLESVSCPTTANCMASGFYTDSGGNQNLVSEQYS